MILSLDGHAVRTAYSAKQSLEELARFAPDVVLLDIGLPEMDGYEVARRIRDQYGREGVRLVAVTGYGQQEDRQRAHDAGFDAHLVKPVEMRLLTQALAGWFH
jgi:CheY-like chemotaxis protein